MFFTAVTASLLALASIASAASPVARKCMNATVPVQVTARNGVFNLQMPQSNLDVTRFVLNQTRQGSNFTQEALTGYSTINGTYNISTQFCQPANSSIRNPVVQVLTHGIGFDKTYWDLSFNNYNYSYVNSALAAGYCTLSYDRLGIGNSSHGDGINEIQLFSEVGAMRALTAMLRNGKFPNVNHTFGNNVMHVGHSFGSAQTFAFAASYPNETAGIVLTGFSANTTFAPYFVIGNNYQIANQNQPLRFGNIPRNLVQNVLNQTPLLDALTPFDIRSLPPSLDYNNGYITNANAEANEALFFHPGAFDPALLIVAEQTKQPVTYGEIMTLGAVPMANPFTGPTLVITGQYDLPFCGGDCLATGGAMASVPAGVAKAFGNHTQNFTAYVQPNTGHGINAHYNATGAYQVINSFLASKGLKST